MLIEVLKVLSLDLRKLRYRSFSPANQHCVAKLSLAHEWLHLSREDLLVVLLVLDLQHVLSQGGIAAITHSCWL